jgi:hypothetical protein
LNPENGYAKEMIESLTKEWTNNDCQFAPVKGLVWNPLADACMADELYEYF